MDNQLLNLKTLTIKNFATFENETITFDEHFNTIVGETGSGKSLVLDALQLIFGSRADKKLVRHGTEFATIEATFKVQGQRIYDFLDELGYPLESDNDELVIKRTVYATGKTKAFINFESSTGNSLMKFARHFIDLVGQFENQKLLSEDYQLNLIDSYADNDELLKKYKVQYNEITSLEKKIEDLKQAQNDIEQRTDYLKFQINEIEKLNPTVEDEKELLKQKEIYLNSAKRKEVFSKALEAISENEYGSSLSLLSNAISILSKNDSLIDSETLDKLSNAEQLISEVSFALARSMDEQYQEEDINAVVERIDLYQRLKRKFGGTTESLLEQYSTFVKELNEVSNLEQTLADTEKKVALLRAEAFKTAQDLSLKRIEFAKKLSSEITTSVRELRMNGATIRIDLQTIDELTVSGINRINFLAETNPGEGFFKVKDIASGGELSRILLSVRSILSSADSISVFLFDEIDTGIGGETAVCTGKALQKVSKKSQVIAITHLPQIAFFADKLISVTKQTDNMRTYSQVEEIVDSSDKQKFIKAMTPIEV